MQICHDSHNIRYREPFGAVGVGETVTLRLYAPGCHGAAVRLWQEGKGETMITMDRSAALFSAEIQVPDEPCILWYFFVANLGEKIVCYGNNSENLGGEGCVYENTQPPSFQITVYEKSESPLWYKDALVYQIFPDRFARGADYEERWAAAQLPEGWKGSSRYFEEDWNSFPVYKKDADGSVTDWQFFGGTFRGIREKIPYLKSLGVSVLYLNPIFRAMSNHRYDTADYMQADPLLGDNEEFRQLASECLKNGIRIVLDGVFSHTGSDSIYFDQYDNFKNFITQDPSQKEAGAFLHKKSRYRNWYRFRNEAPGYDCWWGVTNLPNVEETEPSYDVFICGPEGVLENWIKLGASGFHLDVASELPDSFIKNIHDSLKETDPDSLLLGEVREDASNAFSYGHLRTYFSGEELDGTANFLLRDHAIDYLLGKENAQDFCRKMRSIQENYPPQAYNSSLNILGGVDSPRILSILGGYSTAKEGSQLKDGRSMPAGAALDLPDTDFSKACARLKMLSVLQYVMPGVPCIYYGDEAGMQGSRDPDNRRTYPWGQENKEMLRHYRMLGLIYGAHSALRRGSFQIAGKNGCLFILRTEDSETILTVINPTDKTQDFQEKLSALFGSAASDVSAAYALELLNSKELEVKDGAPTIQIAPDTAMIILLKPEAPERLELPKAAGILCHLSSIPELKDSGTQDSPEAIHYEGALGKRGRAFIDWLAKCGCRLWQLLPVNPVGAGASPYSSPCVFAGEPRLIDRDELPDDSGFEAFCKDSQYWLDDWTDYAVETDFNGWRSSDTLSDDELRRKIQFDQYVFFTQLKALKAYANSKGILLIGDLPIYAAADGADVKAHPECFQLDKDGHPLNVGGVPPDYFSQTGQYWGNPLYQWSVMRRDDYEWWYQRLRLALNCFDYIRLDHFRSFSQYFAIPEGHPPVEGEWQPGPGADFFRIMKLRLDKLPVIAEDLGFLDNDVYNLLKLTGLPGMNIWQFNEKEMREMNSQQIRSRVFYSGTHDNQTLAGWCADSFAGEDPKEKARQIIDELMRCDAPWVIFQLQDLLFLDDSARMNVPGTVGNNWNWLCTQKLPMLSLKR